MKKHFKWMLSLALVCLLSFAFSVPARAAGSLTLGIGERQTVSTSAAYKYSNYLCEWDDGGNPYFLYTDEHDSAVVTGLSPGTAALTCTIYLYRDDGSLEYAETDYWMITVTGGGIYDPPYYADELVVVASPGQTAVNEGERFDCRAEIYGGNGGYRYSWYSSDESVVTLSSGSGASVTATARNAGSAMIQVYAEDRDGRVDTDIIYVTVNAPSRPTSAILDLSFSARGGRNMSMNEPARSISDEFAHIFGEALNYGATVQLGNVADYYGSIRFGNTGELISSWNIYSYASFQDMIFEPAAAGTFITRYTINQGSRNISGTLSITVSGGVGITSVSLLPTSLALAPYSSQYVQLNVSPSNANYTVRWSSSDASVATVSGSGATATVSTNRPGSATITAHVTDVNGVSGQASCTVTVSSAATYDPSLVVSLGSDYHGTDTSASMRREYLDMFHRELDTGRATIRFSSLGSSAVGIMWLNGAAVSANHNYSFQDWVNMDFGASGTGTYLLPYTLQCDNNTLSGTVRINVVASQISAVLSDTSLELASYSSKLLNLEVTPRTARYNVTWYSSNPSIAAVSGGGDSVRVEAKGVEGTADIFASITDSSGVTVTKRCTVIVSRSSTYNPGVSTVLGIRYIGTGTSEAMAKEFRSVFGAALNSNTALIRFSSAGNGVGVMRLPSGAAVSANMDYSFAQYVSMYTDPISVGTFEIPYTLTDNGKSLSGKVRVEIKPGLVDATVLLNSTAPYPFFQPSASGMTGAAELRSVITNAVGSSWSAVRFTSVSGASGTLYANSALTPLGTADIPSGALENLYFLPAQSGDYSASFVVLNADQGILSNGTLHVKVNAAAAELFADVKAGDWYYDAVVWALGKGIANSTGTDSLTGKDLFSPNETCSTANILTFLWRAQGSPAPTIANPFSDVTGSDSYYSAALWAYQRGLVSGTAFRGASPCTRAEALTYMWKLAGSPTSANAGFIDVTPGTDTALAANWAFARGIVDGTGNLSGSPMFSPELTCTRGTIMTLLYRAYR